MPLRDYTTWESDLGSDREELHGYNDELVAYIEPRAKDWVLFDRNGHEVAIRKLKSDVQRLATQLL